MNTHIDQMLDEERPASAFEQLLHRQHAAGSVCILDGGMGSSLWAQFPDWLNTKLWASRLLADAPELIYQTHVAFAAAGARVLDTATYQAHLPGFVEELKCTPAEAAKIMLNGVVLADRARKEYDDRPLVSLSLCAYGAILGAAREFTGDYPAAMLDEGKLADWHYARLEVYTSDPAVASMIDLLSFETIPLLLEMQAVRAAVARLETATGRRWPFMVSAVLPKGEVPDGQPIEDIPAAQLAVPQSGAMLDTGYARPVALAINCTPTPRIASILPALAKGVRKLGLSGVPLVIQPNREYEKTASTRDEAVWLDEMEHIVELARKEAAFGPLGIGGCCGTTPSCIAGLCNRF